MNQDLFDEIMLFFLSSISSRSYLNSEGVDIPRFRPVTNWTAFQKRLTTKAGRARLKPGLYPRSFGKTGVHFYAVRKDEDGEPLVANGYVSRGGLASNYSVGLDAQADHSHGLCQTYAIMFYNGDEGLLKKGRTNYFANVIIGLTYLRNWIRKDRYARDREWSIPSMLRNIEKLYDIPDREARLRRLINKKEIGG